ncbi:nitroreductase family deazaflavin-dependent oxidoreductase [Pseudonocardia phyllosphaerae]|uniref:nitroreductase family deazaflavin-dependent oxidoreductase n=1 Tax=Pseudonocardia phyllosphaerae TaxID=3390502 RepID=UPI00397D31B3
MGLADLVRGAGVAVLDRALRTRALARAPITLYHRGLGRVLGHRMLLLEHTGRRSGLPREVVVEVVGHPGPGRFVVVSGFGERAQWYRNVVADPRVRISVGSRRSQPATARVLPRDEAGELLAAYIARHPAAWEQLGQVVERALGRPVGPGDPPPLVEFRLGTS